MQYTGERVIPNEMDPLNTLLLEHVARYYFAAAKCNGRVLDIACGVGYGCFLIAKYAKKSVDELVGVDSDSQTISYAASHYGHPKVEFRVGDALDPELTEDLGKFDTVISFETIEHLPSDTLFVGNLYKLLNPGGTLVLSTPFGRGRNYPSNQRFHEYQLNEEEFRELFTPFSQVEYYYQQGVTIYPESMGPLPVGIAVAVK